MIKQIVPSKVCLNCLGCCRFSRPDTLWSPFLLDEEVRDFLARDIPPSAIDSGKRIRPVPGREPDTFICGFLNPQDNRCKIYDFRPLDCQLYPFMINREGKKVFLAADLRCPFVKENLEGGEFKKFTRSLTEWLNSPAQLNLLRHNLHMIQEYAEVSNLAELKI